MRHPFAPQAETVSRSPEGGLNLWDAGERQVAWWWVSCHGGAGVSTLQALVPGGADGGRGWPILSGGGTSRVVLVARADARGLAQAQLAARQWASGGVPHVQLMGLAAVADAPGRPPRALGDLLTLVSGGFPKLWTIPWMESLRFGELPTRDRTPKNVATMAADLSRFLS
ncbi:hypothetical protein GCM10023205_84820 [Yinghuangia aomiensis]|uniref:Uncharacterized protein n=2 Tax=Yinghuangia aomiensis TaxID=676205 RepID=A0ABP9IHL5_9ACTN